MDKLSVWGQGEYYARKYDVIQLLENDEGLFLYMENVEEKESIIVHYDTIVCGYKNVDESFGINIVEELIDSFGKDFVCQHTFFEVIDSSYKKEIEIGTCGAVSANNLHHMKVLAANVIIDIVAFNEPRIIEKYSCPCCGNMTLNEQPPGTFEICSICGWEDDEVQFDNPDYEGGANQLSLNQAKNYFFKKNGYGK